jgi:hypothetical protein
MKKTPHNYLQPICHLHYSCCYSNLNFINQSRILLIQHPQDYKVADYQIFHIIKQYVYGPNFLHAIFSVTAPTLKLHK